MSGIIQVAKIAGFIIRIQGDSMKVLLATIAAAAWLFTGQASASQALAQKSGCLACHAIDKKVLGPSMKDVAAKYKGDATAEAKLVAKVKKVVAVFGALCRCQRIVHK